MAMTSWSIVFIYSFAVLLFSRHLFGSPHEDEALGPDSCPATEFYSESCNGDNGYSSTQSTDESAEMASRGSSDLADNSDAGSLFGFIHRGLSGVRRGLSTAVGKAYKTAKDTGDKMYSKIKNATLEFIEGVRQVLREEFVYYYWVETALSTVADTAMAPGTPLNTLGIYVWTIVLFVLCLTLSYVFLYCFSYRLVFGFICFVVLLHHFFEPQWILHQFYRLLIYLGQLLYYVGVQHPYIFCFIVVCLCLASFVIFVYFSCIQPILNCLERRNERQRRKAVADSIVDLGKKLDHIEEKIDKLKGLPEQVRDMNLKMNNILAAMLTK